MPLSIIQKKFTLAELEDELAKVTAREEFLSDCFILMPKACSSIENKLLNDYRAGIWEHQKTLFYLVSFYKDYINNEKEQI